MTSNQILGSCNSISTSCLCTYFSSARTLEECLYCTYSGWRQSECRVDLYLPKPDRVRTQSEFSPGCDHMSLHTCLNIIFLSLSDDVNVTMVQIPRLLVSTTSIFLRWSLLPILMDSPVARYMIRYKRLDNLPVDGMSSMTNFTLSNLVPATEYTVSITVVYDLGNTATATSSPVTVMVTTNTPGIVEYWIVHYSPVEYWIVHYSPVEYWIVHYSPVEYWIVHYSQVEYWIVHYSPVEYWIVHYSPVEY